MNFFVSDVDKIVSSVLGYIKPKSVHISSYPVSTIYKSIRANILNVIKEENEIAIFEAFKKLPEFTSGGEMNIFILKNPKGLYDIFCVKGKIDNPHVNITEDYLIGLLSNENKIETHVLEDIPLEFAREYVKALYIYDSMLGKGDDARETNAPTPSVRHQFIRASNLWSAGRITVLSNMVVCEEEVIPMKLKYLENLDKNTTKEMRYFNQVLDKVRENKYIGTNIRRLKP